MLQPNRIAGFEVSAARTLFRVFCDASSRHSVCTTTNIVVETLICALKRSQKLSQQIPVIRARSDESIGFEKDLAFKQQIAVQQILPLKQSKYSSLLESADLTSNTEIGKILC